MLADPGKVCMAIYTGTGTPVPYGTHVRTRVVLHGTRVPVPTYCNIAILSIAIATEYR